MQQSISPRILKHVQSSFHCIVFFCAERGCELFGNFYNIKESVNIEHVSYDKEKNAEILILNLRYKRSLNILNRKKNT